MKKLERDFHRKKYQHELKVLEGKVKALNEFVGIADKLSKGARSVEELDKYLNGTTGFKNARVSADAMSVLDEYTRCLELEAVWSGIDFATLDQKGIFYEIKKDYLITLEDSCRVYYSDEQAKQISVVQKAVDLLNNLDLPYRASLNYHPLYQKWEWSKRHTDSNLGRTRA